MTIQLEYHLHKDGSWVGEDVELGQKLDKRILELAKHKYKIIIQTTSETLCKIDTKIRKKIHRWIPILH